MWKTIVVGMLCLFAFPAKSAELEKGKIYRLEVTVTDLASQAGTDKAIAAKYSTFVVVDTQQTGYIVRFVTVYDFDDITSTVRKDHQYLLPKTIQGSEVTYAAKPTYSGPVSGPLIVPFKYRIDDSSITGDATLGCYAGYGFSVPVGQDARIPITPFFSAGMSQVSVGVGQGTENKTAFTWSAGVLIQNWGSLNIGVLYGQDRIGDKTWEHEGDGWISLMVGWKLN